MGRHHLRCRVRAGRTKRARLGPGNLAERSVHRKRRTNRAPVAVRRNTCPRAENDHVRCVIYVFVYRRQSWAQLSILSRALSRPISGPRRRAKPAGAVPRNYALGVGAHTQRASNRLIRCPKTTMTGRSHYRAKEWRLWPEIGRGARIWSRWTPRTPSVLARGHP